MRYSLIIRFKTYSFKPFESKLFFCVPTFWTYLILQKISNFKSTEAATRQQKLREKPAQINVKYSVKVSSTMDLIRQKTLSGLPRHDAQGIRSIVKWIFVKRKLNYLQ